ncbi:hypothetical protein R50345_04155 [Paenibacillus sp. FSL R5-0345]|uniref:hypothetical protein n=1 Tax=Paenibacillus sp. FSL R5-0345 TaxID=1536770 RepID=UPI0004F5E5C2|nr:hypothetical protein [Paenibacillus sp. FSL R5-0345]AIQ33898.1 hypothetical protein R50345_04155 [Paenibacillus sp. FSL R5-0345]
MHITNMTSAMGTRLNVAVSHQTNDKTINSNSKTSGSGDHLSISKSAKAAFQNQSKMSGMVDSLLKQKQSIIDSKNSLIERTTQSSHSLDSIQDQLKDFDKQLQTIDQQIAKYTFEEQQKNLEKAQKEDLSDEPKTEQETQNERLNTIVAISQNVSQMEVVSSTHSKMHGEARVLTKEIESDEARSTHSATAKREQLSKIEDRISEMNETLGNTIKDTGDKIKDQERTEKLATYQGIQRLAEDSDKSQLEILI